MKFNYWLLGYPRFTDDQIKAIADVPHTTRADYDYIRSFNTRLNTAQMCWSTVCLVGFIKDLAFPFYTIAVVESVARRYATGLTPPNNINSLSGQVY